MLMRKHSCMQHPNAPILIEDIRPAKSHLRVAVVTETYPPEVNGVALTLSRLVEGLRAREHSVQLVRPRQRSETGAAVESLPREEVLTRGFPVPRYPNLQLGLPARRFLEGQWMLRRPDLVHIATEGPLGWSALKTASKLRIPVTSEFRTNFHSYSSHYGLGWLSKPIMTYLRRFHNQCASTMVPTHKLALQLQEAGFERLQVVGRAVDTQRFTPALRDTALRASWGASQDTPVILCAGRLAREKNLQLLIRAYAMTKLVRPDVRLVLAGDGPARDELRAAAPDAVFTGSLPQNELARYYASADIFGFPSQSETFGNVVLEAMASGMAVVAFNYAAAAENIQSDHNGVLVEMDDESGFSRAIVSLAIDRQRAQALGAQARSGVEGSTWPSIVQQVENIMSDAIEHPLRTSNAVASARPATA